MKKFLIVFALLLAFCVAFASCGETPNGEGSSQSSKVESNIDTESSGTVNGGSTQDSVGGSTDESAGDSGATDESTGTSSGTASGTDISSGTADTTDKSETGGTADSSVTDNSSDISSNVGSETTDSSTDSATDSSQQKPPVDEPPVIEPEDWEPNIPDGPIEIALNGETVYTVVYEADNERVEEFANKFVDYMSQTHGIELDMTHDQIPTMPENCIFIGNVEGANRVKNKLNSVNDFGACVSGNDYVLYATNDRLYEFLYDVLVEDVLFLIRNKTWKTEPKKNFVYSQSKYKDTRYVDYILEKQGLGINRRYFLTKIFEDRTYYTADGTEIPYRLYVPYDYDRTKEYPVLLFMHGAGERGNNNEGNLYHMFETLFSMENSPLWDSIIIAPQCPNGEQWVDTPWKEGNYSVNEVPESDEIKAVLGILGTVERSFPTDKNRYYVTGLSMGGFGTWDLIMRHSDLFAAAVPICGGADASQAGLLVDMPIYTLHGTNDIDVPCSGTKEMVAALKRLGSEVIFFEELSGYSHNVWGYAAEKDEIWFWLFEQTREGR